MKFYVIGDEETILGFRLAGVEGEAVRTREEAQDVLEKIFQKEDLGIIIIPERIADTIRQVIEKYIYTTTFPLIIEIPDRLGPMEKRGSVRELIRAAVGVRL